MPDDPDPPRKVYGFKPREFERANPTRPDAPADFVSEAPVADPKQKIDVNDLIRAGAGTGTPLGAKKVAPRANDVHAILRDNFERSVAAGDFDLGKLDDSHRRHRIRNYWIAIAAVNLPLGGIAFYVGHGSAYFFVFALSGMALFSSWLTWRTFFLRTHYRD